MDEYNFVNKDLGEINKSILLLVPPTGQLIKILEIDGEFMNVNIPDGESFHTYVISNIIPDEWYFQGVFIRTIEPLINTSGVQTYIPNVGLQNIVGEATYLSVADLVQTMDVGGNVQAKQLSDTLEVNFSFDRANTQDWDTGNVVIYAILSKYPPNSVLI